MKLTRKILAVLLSILMLAALCVPAMADDDPTAPTEPGDYSANTTHTFKTYQIFSGTQAADSTKLADVQWGVGVNEAGFLAAIQNDDTFVVNGENVFKYVLNAKGEKVLDENGQPIPITIGMTDSYGKNVSAKRVAQVISAMNWHFDSVQAQALARAAYANRKGDPGKTDGLEAGYYLVVDLGYTAPDPEKPADERYVNIALVQVTVGGKVDTWQKVSVPTVTKKVDDNDDHGKLVDSADYSIGDDVPFTLTAKFELIDHYKTYKVVFHDTLTKGLTYNKDYSVTLIDADGTEHTVTDKFTVSEGEELTFTCGDILDKDVGAKNHCTIVVKYTAKLNEDAVIGVEGNPNTVYLEYTNDPNCEIDPETGKYVPSDSTDNTEKDKVVVYTYELKLTKYDDKGSTLAGAQFKLQKKVGDGENDYVDYILAANDTNDGRKAQISADGTEFLFTGLDAGDYRIVETETPAGYNAIEPIEFTITASHTLDADEPELIVDDLKCVITKYDPEMDTPPTISLLYDEDNKALGFTGDVVNVSGLLLPEAGGTGTTMFYVMGSLILLCAVVALITRRRMGETA